MRSGQQKSTPSKCSWIRGWTVSSWPRRRRLKQNTCVVFTIPAALWSLWTGRPGLNIETVSVDMTGISYESTRHLLEAGHRRIAFVSTLKTDAPYAAGMVLDSSQISERLDGMRRAFEEKGLNQPLDLVRLNAGDAESIERVTRDLLVGPEAATAIIASDGLIALSVVEAIQELELSIPADVSFLMYDDFAWTRLTTRH